MFRATAELAEGAEVNFSYTAALHEPTAARHANTRKFKHFECGCARCADPAEGGRVAVPLGPAWVALLAEAEAAESPAAALPLRRAIAAHAEVLYPAHHTSKGMAQEAVGRAAVELLKQEPMRVAEGLAVEAAAALAEAARQFTVCNGAKSEVVRRIRDAEGRLAAAVEKAEQLTMT